MIKSLEEDTNDIEPIEIYCSISMIEFMFDASLASEDNLGVFIDSDAIRGVIKVLRKLKDDMITIDSEYGFLQNEVKSLREELKN
ncbi:MAG: hypothetical protein KAH06_09260 [Desulfobacterales bacterium]|nr:hypothetical protein [Desulfobacterales bacterium]